MTSAAVTGPSTPLREGRDVQTPGDSPSLAASVLRTRTSVYGIDDRVALQLGSRRWTYGIAGEPCPRGCVDVTQFADVSYSGLWTLDCAREFDEDTPLERATAANIQRGLRQIFFKMLMIDPQQRRILLIENSLLPHRIRRMIIRILFDNLKVLAISLVPTHLCALLPTGELTALVVDCGHQETTVVPVFKCRPLIPFLATSSRAGRAVTQRLRLLLPAYATYTSDVPENVAPELSEDQRRRVLRDDILDARTIEDVKTRGLFVGLRKAKSPRGSLPVDTEDVEGIAELYRQYSTATSATLTVANTKARGTLLIPGWIRECAAEVLFEGDDVEEPSLAALIIEVLERLSIDLRRPLTESILVVGGLSMLPGFVARLRSEIEILMPTSKINNLGSSLALLNDRAPAFSPSLLPWLGGSLAGVLRIGAEDIGRHEWQDRVQALE